LTLSSVKGSPNTGTPSDVQSHAGSASPHGDARADPLLSPCHLPGDWVGDLLPGTSRRPAAAKVEPPALRVGASRSHIWTSEGRWLHGLHATPKAATACLFMLKDPGKVREISGLASVKSEQNAQRAAEKLVGALDAHRSRPAPGVRRMATLLLPSDQGPTKSDS
jgi:hypothetical protein